jgi:hypothetical protein
MVFCMFPALAPAWSNKEHIQMTRIAVMQIIADPATPEELKTWLREATPGLRDLAGERDYFMSERVGIVTRGVDGLTFFATVPDMHALMDHEKKEIAPFGVGERLLHFIDVELFNPDESKRVYRDDLSGKPAAADFPKDITDYRYKRAGMLPFRVEQCYAKLVDSIRDGRLVDKPGQYPRDEHAARWAGFLSHYVQDNTQPHHSTLDYKSASYFAVGTKTPNVHAEIEYRMCDDEFEDFMALREEFWPLFVEAMETMEDPIESDDPWGSTLDVSLKSYDALPLIGRAAAAAILSRGEIDTAAFYRFRGPCFDRELSVMELKAMQQAWAVKRTQRLLLKAWNEANQAD